ncbi:MAG: SDR family oxidoreductase [Anaerolineales bacterium]|uniref:SDR family oxidoreductase n=1 Tax=Candidatus Desulfolinea nitratireducens TaxID=2841698 RepID=A0A8J6TFA9_9CHLR|nr:SDR family oxidoreductase [Candidatus Desulfolinea nitratireducens]MBL6961755.1 SDR family oxidoreductase [Anaerolineales bacterium]
MSLKIDLSGKRALVSGVSSGIGSGVARILAQAGCDISGCGLDEFDSAGAQHFIESVEKEGGMAEYLSLDLTDPGEIERWVNTARSTMGGIDIIISNAGRNIFEGLENCTNAAWEECMNLNLASHWRLAKSAYPYLKESGRGVFIITTSNHAFNTIPDCFPYNIAKAGLVAMVQSLAIEWGPHIRAVGIAPGFVDTPAGRNWFNTFADPDAELARTKASHPVNRICSVEEIGALAAFLASEWGGFISGTTILADGGRSALMQDGEGYGKYL